jgi:hypothetical protein
MEYIEKKYYPGLYIDYNGKTLDSWPVSPRSFNVFRATVQFQTMTNGIEEVEVVTTTVYNYDGENYSKRYYPEPGWIWGGLSNDGAFNLVGEEHPVEFDIE